MLSGVLVGFAGLLLVAGTNYTLATDSVQGRGFTAILVAWLGKFNPFLMGGTSLLYVFIDQGSSQTATDLGLGGYYADIITGIFFFLVIACEFFINYRVKFRSFRTTKDEVLPATPADGAEKTVEEVAA